MSISSLKAQFILILKRVSKDLNSYKNLKTIVVALLGVSLLSACASKSGYDENGYEHCDGEATYTLIFDSTWSAETHPDDFPDASHYSELIGATHNGDVSFWSPGKTASSGIKDVAELGVNWKFIKAVNWAIKIGEAKALVHGPDIKHSPGRAQVGFQVDGKHSLITILSMIAPSPDWFVGVSGLDMCENGTWVPNKTIGLKAYDAGTDDGANYTAGDQTSEPKMPISLLRSGIHHSNGVIPQLGTFSFELIPN